VTQRQSAPRDPHAGLLREAGAAARAGDINEAERLYRRVLDQDQQNVAAWMGLGAVVSEPTQKAACFERALEIDPENDDAAASLERLQAMLPASGPEILHCAFHPKVETVLRCSQCGRPICVRCANPYPVGQLCPACVRGRRPLYYQTNLPHLAAAGGAALLASGLAGLLFALVIRWGFGFWLALLLGPMAGSILAQVVLWAGRRHRGLVVQITVAACTVLGSFFGAAIIIPYSLLLAPFSLPFLLYVALAVSSTVAWLR
jgi:hypothetical protein